MAEGGKELNLPEIGVTSFMEAHKRKPLFFRVVLGLWTQSGTLSNICLTNLDKGMEVKTMEEKVSSKKSFTKVPEYALFQPFYGLVAKICSFSAISQTKLLFSNISRTNIGLLCSNSGLLQKHLPPPTPPC